MKKTIRPSTPIGDADFPPQLMQQQQQQPTMTQPGQQQQTTMMMRRRNNEEAAKQQQQQQQQQGSINNNNNIINNNNSGSSKTEMQVQALSQKNHRLAKELSDLRVRHREETKVVSRLTMENMNLASRCREAISQVAALKKELMTYQKRQNSLTGEYAGLQREVSLLKKQMSGGKNCVGGLPNANGSSGASANGDVHPSKLQHRNSASPTTDLDRIMSSQKFGGIKKQHSYDAPSAVGGDDTPPQDGGAKDDVAKQFRAVAENPAVVSSDSKIPISVAPTSLSIARSGSTGGQNDDQFDADIDMVDFFNKQSTSTSAAVEAQRQQSNVNTKSLHHHVRKPKANTDDRMPGDVVSPPPGSAFSPEGSARKLSAGDSLLSSLDAFEASFASAFPETSFSITSDAPKETKMDMTFDVPDFGDPFFNNFKTTTSTPTMVFDSTPMSFDMSGPSMDSVSSSKGKAHKGTKSNHRSVLAPLSPQSMSAEIEQLDAIANLTGGNDGDSGSVASSSSGSRISRKIRNVKQPVSYKEPSTGSKLRRGDVLFPKVDAQQKYQQKNNIDKTAATKPGTASTPKGVLKDLEQVSSLTAGIDLGKDP